MLTYRLRGATILCSLITFLLSSLRCANAQIRYSITDLGIAGSLATNAYGINNAGQVVGQIVRIGASHGFLYSKGKMWELMPLGGNNCFATAINDAGQVVGWSEFASGSSQMHAVIYTYNKQKDAWIPEDLGTLPGGGNSIAL